MSKATGVEPEVVLKADSASTSSQHNSESVKSRHFASEREGGTFDGSGLSEDYYKPVATYEGIHRYDPKFDWEPEEERKIVRKVPTSPPQH